MGGKRLIVLVILAVQVLIPTYVLITQSRPARFGWHMFAAAEPPPTVTVHHPGGRLEQVPGREFIARYRPEVAYWRYLPAHVCGLYEAAGAVTVTRRDGNPALVTCDD